MHRCDLCRSLEEGARIPTGRQLVQDGTVGQNELNDAYITMCVHAGIDAADVICCRRLNVHHQGENHNEAITTLGRVDRQLASDLAVC